MGQGEEGFLGERRKDWPGGQTSAAPTPQSTAEAVGLENPEDQALAGPLLQMDPSGLTSSRPSTMQT